MGLALGASLVARGATVAGVCRPGTSAAARSAVGVAALGADLADAPAIAALPGDWDWVIHCAAPSVNDPEAYRKVYLEGARNLARRWGRGDRTRLVFIGSTSVYGSSGGAPVTEATPPAPVSDTGRVLLAAEEVWRGEGNGIVLRAAGIYGPGRHRLDAVKRGVARIRGDGSRRMNLIHRDDLVAAIIAAAERGTAGEVYNVSDDAPPTEREFYEWVCRRLKVDLPTPADVPEATVSGKGGGRLRGATHKWVVARKLREATGWKPGYATFREGYLPLLAAWPTGAGPGGASTAPTGGAGFEAA